METLTRNQPETKQPQTKSIQGLVQESIPSVTDFTVLDEIEQTKLIEQREEQNNSQSIGD